MRPPTHDDPHAIPRNGTEVPWVEIPGRDGDSWEDFPARETSRAGKHRPDPARR